MRLSEAMRLGAMLKPQGRSLFIHNGATCALGAALDATGAVTNGAAEYSRLRLLWPVLDVRVVPPAIVLEASSPLTTLPLMYIIEDLNDSFRWTREQIAEFVATVEPPDVLNERTALDRTADAVDPQVGNPGTLTTRV